MAQPIKLNPKVRERKDARVTAVSLAEYIIASPDRQDAVLHDSRFMSAYVSAKHREAIDVIRAYATDPYRDVKTLEQGLDALELKSKSEAFSPAQREEATRCIETLGFFMRGINAFGVNSAQLFLPPDFKAIDINGVMVSVQPTLLVGKKFPPQGKDKIGLVHIRPQKTPDPDDCKREETKLSRQDYRREVARYVLVLQWMQFRDTGLLINQIDTKKMSVWDLRMKEAIPFPSDRLSRIKRINAACGQISRLWGTIQPKPGDLA